MLYQFRGLNYKSWRENSQYPGEHKLSTLSSCKPENDGRKIGSGRDILGVKDT